MRSARAAVAAAATAILAIVACTSTSGLSGGEDDTAAIDASDARIDADAGPTPTSSIYRAEVLADSPIVYYRCGEAAGAVAKNEVKADGGIGDGTYVGVSLGRPGAIAHDDDTAMELVDGRLFVDDERLAFRGKEPFTLEAWVMPKLLDDAFRRLFSHEKTAAPREGYLLYVQKDAIATDRTFDGGNEYAQYAGALSTSKWTHVVTTYDGTSIRLFLDGSLVASSSGATQDIIDPKYPFTVGTDSQLLTAATSFVGLVDEIAVYDKALTAVRVAAHHQAGTAK